MLGKNSGRIAGLKFKYTSKTDLACPSLKSIEPECRMNREASDCFIFERLKVEEKLSTKFIRQNFVYI